MYSTPELRDAWTIRIGEDEHSLKIGNDFLEELYFPERRIPKRHQASHLTAGMGLAFHDAVRYTGSVTCRQTTGTLLPAEGKRENRAATPLAGQFHARQF